MKVAIVHEWFVSYAGSEKVVEQLIKCYPEADIFALIDCLNPDEKDFLQGKEVKTSFLQKIPFIKQKYQLFLPLMPFAIEQFDLSNYDVIISSSHAVAKGVLTGPNQLHICYCHSPIRYAWDLQHQYIKESNKGFLLSWLMRYFLHKIRLWDYRTANGVDYFIANSNFIARRIKKVYGRDSEVIFPPVDIQKFTPQINKQEYYFTASRLVPYKKVDLIAKAFAKMPDKKLIIAGTGDGATKIQDLANKYTNIKYLGFISDDKMIELMQNAKAFVFAAEEDFGIIPVEAQACATPVIAYGKGGVCDSVITESDLATGVFFYKQDTDSIINAVREFESIQLDFSNCISNSQKFSEVLFRNKILNFVTDKYKQFQSK
ncbi:MAG: glycosyltransferase family 4 protein [Burkholderiales bacterium]|nr:glycosyltransferase family 4 protein [Burkholderiales bacterium]